ncbi:hypothetical protein IFM89_009969 [Coptis chinensis]|uniref:40S ribosomal protein S8 n=1 Tax=Coptis chinensis TaxID=261450 RepID=A0A835LMK6_9MAGN|nr:hypothetical protein IFM89_009969 [Coptis chinensis]
MRSDVVYNASNNALVRTQTLVKSAIIQVDAAPFRQWYLQHYGVEIGRKKKSAAKKEGVEEGEAAVVEEVKKKRRLQFVECPNDISGIIDATKVSPISHCYLSMEVTDLKCLVRDVALSFRSSVSSILLKLRKAEGTSGESIDALAKVDIVKQRMEAAYETLQDVAGLTQLSPSVEDVFASGDLPQAAETLANMRYCLFAAVEFANVRKQLEVLEDRVEEMLQPHLSEALSLSAYTHSDWKKPRRNCSTFHHNILEGLSLPIWILAFKRIQAIGTGRSKTCGTHHRSSDLKICFSFGCCPK